jgi:CheY-like chemotaxis protein
VNLLKNALEAVEDQPGARIRITAQRQDSFVVLELWNPGPPLSDETRKHLFTPYFTTRSEQGGTGLGLWVTHRIVMQAGGKITAQNVESGGVVFRVWLPLASGSKQTTQPPPEREQVADDVRQARVLVVDDERTVREVLRLMVREMGWANVETCASGEDALTRLGELEYEAILLDLRMPGVSGAEVYEKLPDSVRRRIIFVTGDTLNTTTTRFLESTRQPTLLKPIRTAELTRAVQEVVTDG